MILRIPQDSLDPCTKIAELIQAKGGRALLVGGCVRDSLLNIPAKDVDMEVYGLGIDAIEEALGHTYRLDAVGRSFGVLIVKGHNIDIALPRRESKVGSKHTDFVFQGDPSMLPREAASRRDFTINAISFDPLSQELIDPFSGVNDLKNGCLRHVSDAFGEDPLRVLRGMQFIARFDLAASPQTLALCRKLTPRDLPPERLWDEWKKLILRGSHISKGLQFLHACGWLRYFPELNVLIGCQQDPKWHPEGDVWTHTGHCMDAFAKNRIGDEWEDLVVGLAVLCHDIGKPVSTFLDLETGRIRSPRHDIRGVPIARVFLERLTRQKKVFEEVLPLIECHMRPLALYKSGAGDSAIRRLANRVKRIDRLVRVAHADKSGRPPLQIDDFSEGEWLLNKAAELNIQDRAPKPLIMGRHLIELGLKPGPHFNKILKSCYEAQLEGLFTDIENGKNYLNAKL